ncbi:MAG TPA: efflux RND transporter permease subunit [Elusimicrobiota bacterium]|nr:efflux RND transporter permease subunit [Elusimicrobiota bacterium]
MGERLLRAVLKAPGAVAAGALLLLMLGVQAYRGLRVDLFPPLNFPILNVITELPSYSSLEMERQVTVPLESAAGGVLGVTRLRSTSATGISMVSVEFEWGTDMLVARQLLNEAASAARSQLPAAAEPSIETLSAALSEIEGYSLQGGSDPVALRDLAVYTLKPRLQRVPGVYKVIVMGGQIEEFSVRPNPYLLIKYDLTLDDLKTALAANNILASPGVVNSHDQELVLHANGQFAGAGEIADVVVAVKAGIPVRVRDVARVSSGFQYQRGDVSERGAPAVTVNILKQPQFDTGAVADAVKKEIDAFAATLPKGFTVHNYYDQAGLVRDSIRSVSESVWIGGLLVLIVLGFFLRDWRTTLIAALSIPLSVVAAVVALRGFGVGLNIMSLGGLAIGTGIIVDDAIVVLENIFRWLATEELRAGKPQGEIVVGAAAEVIRPVIVSTLTNIAIFAPMVYVAGFAGRLFAPVSITVTFALLASLVVALTVIPLLAFRWLSAGAHAGQEADALHRAYGRTLDWALRHRVKVLAAGAAIVALVPFAFRRLDTEFLPGLDEGAVLLQTIMPAGTSLSESRRLNLKLERWAAAVPGVETVVRRTGHAPGAEDTDSVNHSDIMLKLAPKSRRAASLPDMIDAMQDKTNGLAGVVVNYLMPLADKINDALGGVPADIGVDLYGPDLDVLHAKGQALVAAMEKVPGLADLRPPTDAPVPSLEIAIDKKAAGRLGVSGDAIHEALGAYASGVEATSIREVQKEIPVTLRYAPPGQDLDLEALGSLPLKTAGGSVVPLEQVAKLSFGGIPSEIYHDHLTRKLTITANVKGRNVGDAAADIARAAKTLDLPRGYSWDFSGKYKTEQGALSNLAGVLAMAVFVVAAILWLEFRSVTAVLLILLTLPLAAVGAVMALWAAKQTVNVSSMIGAVMLVGVVVRNGIILLDYVNAQRARGLAVKDAVRSAAMKRARPILMTATVTILGLVPLATGWGSGAELQRPLAVAVIGGLAASTLLTLLLLPVAASLVLRD